MQYNIIGSKDSTVHGKTMSQRNYITGTTKEDENSKDDAHTMINGKSLMGRLFYKLGNSNLKMLPRELMESLWLWEITPRSH